MLIRCSRESNYYPARRTGARISTCICQILGGGVKPNSSPDVTADVRGISKANLKVAKFGLKHYCVHYIGKPENSSVDYGLRIGLCYFVCPTFNFVHCSTVEAWVEDSKVTVADRDCGYGVSRAPKQLLSHSSVSVSLLCKSPTNGSPKQRANCCYSMCLTFVERNVWKCKC